ncbi:hypothetical protein Q5752_006797 [Cryptotrichosporon argae]
MTAAPTPMPPAWSPFKHMLRVSNLPPALSSSRLVWVLAHPPCARRRDAGVSLVQVETYTPASPQPALATFRARLARLRPTPVPATIPLGSPASSSTSSLSSVSPAVSDPPSDPSSASLSSSRSSASSLRASSTRAAPATSADDSPERAVALLHFRTEEHLVVARRMLGRVTFEGVVPRVQRVVFDGAPLRRLWARTTAVGRRGRGARQRGGPQGREGG